MAFSFDPLPIPRGFTTPPQKPDPEARIRAEREALHLLDNFLRDRADFLREQAEKKGRSRDA